eukprot:TRINITY_DN25003_c0_g1_i1.p1 TRINITY_DN25003_c0_g1~~TRINITY_DN25003_c0_g1_i1.p1  ORF type:complete len:210 (+),score=51.20 TRINITY_DN25003_c0_g1_i1:79-708(+)
MKAYESILMSGDFIDKGLIKTRDLKEIWSSIHSEFYHDLLSLFQEHNLVFSIPSVEKLIITELVPVHPPPCQFLWNSLTYKGVYVGRTFRFSGIPVPCGLIFRIVVQLTRRGEVKSLWQSGILVVSHKVRALIKTPSINSLTFLVVGVASVAYRWAFELLNLINTLLVEWYSITNYDIMISCPQCLKDAMSLDETNPNQDIGEMDTAIT